MKSEISHFGRILGLFRDTISSYIKRSCWEIFFRNGLILLVYNTPSTVHEIGSSSVKMIVWIRETYSHRLSQFIATGIGFATQGDGTTSKNYIDVLNTVI